MGYAACQSSRAGESYIGRRPPCPVCFIVGVSCCLLEYLHVATLLQTHPFCVKLCVDSSHISSFVSTQLTPPCLPTRPLFLT